MASEIHPSSVVEPGARLGEGVRIGPFCHVGPQVELGDGVILKSHAVVDGRTRIGAGCEIWPFASVGGKTQDLKYKGGSPGLVVGERTVIRECATLSCATDDGKETVVGDDCLIMAYCHVAHDCIVGNHVIMSNGATLAGHVHVGDWAVLAGYAGIHQFVRIGTMAMVGACSKAVKDIPPYMLCDGDPLKVFGPNKIGLERRGLSPETRSAILQAYKLVYRSNLLTADALARIEAELPPFPEIAHFVSFIRASERGITR